MIDGKEVRFWLGTVWAGDVGFSVRFNKRRCKFVKWSSGRGTSGTGNGSGVDNYSNVK